MRLFFGLEPTPEACLEVAAWRDRALPPLDRPVPAQNLHITLAFLGDVPPRKIEALMDNVTGVRAGALQVSLDELGYWPKPRILWLGPVTTPAPVALLARDLRRAARTAQISVDNRDYRAHLTIARNCLTPPPAAVMLPAVILTFSRFSLFESINSRHGVRYQALSSWELGP